MVKGEAPLKLFVCICETKESEQIIDFLNEQQDMHIVSLLGEEAIKNGLLDVLGVGKIEKTVLIGFVKRVKYLDLLKKLDELLIKNEKSIGVAFTIKINALAMSALEYVKQQNVQNEPKKQEKTKEITENNIVEVKNVNKAGV